MPLASSTPGRAAGLPPSPGKYSTSAMGQTMPIGSARRMSAFASYHPETAIPLPAHPGRLDAVGGRSNSGRMQPADALQPVESSRYRVMGILASVSRDFARREAARRARREGPARRARAPLHGAAAPPQRGAAATPHAWPVDPSRFGSAEAGAKPRAITARPAAKPAPEPQR